MQQTRGFYWQPKSVAAHEPDLAASAQDDMEDQLDLMLATGANAVFVPHQSLNPTLLDLARARHIDVFVDWRVFAGEDLRRANPDSAPIDATGAPFDRDGWYVPACPNHPQLRAHHLQSINTCLETYARDLAGLWLDFIRFPVRWEGATPALRALCFCPNCLRLFLGSEQQSFSRAEIRQHATQILADRHAEWVAWKCTCIVEFVHDVRRLIDVHTEELQLGMFSLPWRREDFDGAIRTVAGQDLGRLSELVDCCSPMVYHMLCDQPTAWIRTVTEDVYQWTRKPVLPIIQSFDRPTVMSAEALDAALSSAQAASGSAGVMIFTFAPLLESAEKDDVVRNHFRA